MDILYKRIKQRREELDMSQDELAKKAGYKSRSSINKIELGKSDIPQSKIVAIADALSTTPAYLMGWEDKDTASKRIAEQKESNEILDAYNMADIATKNAARRVLGLADLDAEDGIITSDQVDWDVIKRAIEEQANQPQLAAYGGGVRSIPYDQEMIDALKKIVADQAKRGIDGGEEK